MTLGATRKHRFVKLSAHREGLPGKEEFCFIIAPLIPAYKAGLAGCYPAQKLEVQILGGPLDPKLGKPGKGRHTGIVPTHHPVIGFPGLGKPFRVEPS